MRCLKREKYAVKRGSFCRLFLYHQYHIFSFFPLSLDDLLLFDCFDSINESVPLLPGESQDVPPAVGEQVIIFFQEIYFVPISFRGSYTSHKMEKEEEENCIHYFRFSIQMVLNGF